MQRKQKKGTKKAKEHGKKLTLKQERFCELVASGHDARDAYLLSGYSSRAVGSSPYILSRKQELAEYIRNLIDRHIPALTRNDIKLARLKVHEGEGLDISPSLITDAKSRLYDRSSLGPVIKRIEQQTLSIHADLTEEQRRQYLAELIAEAKRMSNLPEIDIKGLLPPELEGKEGKGD